MFDFFRDLQWWWWLMLGGLFVLIVIFIFIRKSQAD